MTEFSPYLDYAVVIVSGVFIFAGVSWMVSARKWFTGPLSNIADNRSVFNGSDAEIQEKAEEPE